jgi:hypothetical protein
MHKDLEQYVNSYAQTANTKQDFAYALSVSESADNPDSVYTLYLLLCYQVRRECERSGKTFDSDRFYNSFVGNIEHPAYVKLAEETV